MDGTEFDDVEVERLLRGPSADDARRDPVARLLLTAASGLEPLAGGPAPTMLAAMQAATSVPDTAYPDALAARRRRWVAGTAIVVGTLCLGTSAAALSGSLPDAVQDVVHDIAESIGLDIPDGTPDQVVPVTPADPPGLDEETPGGGVGPEGTPPGQGGEIPGGGVGPEGTPPGQGGEIPGGGVGPVVTPPGQGEETPGGGVGPVTPPGQGSEIPGGGGVGSGVTSPSQSGENPAGSGGGRP